MFEFLFVLPHQISLGSKTLVLWWSSIHRRIELMMPNRHPLSQQVCRASICEHSVNTELIDGNNDVIFIFIFMCWKTQATMLHLEKKDHMCKCVCYYERTLKQLNDTFHTHARSQVKALKILRKLYTVSPNSRSKNSQLVLRSSSTVRLDTASSDSFVAPYFAILGSRTSPADFTAAVTAALSTSFAMGQEGPASPGHCDIGFCCGTLLFDSRRASFIRGHSHIGFCRGTLLCGSRMPSFLHKPGDSCTNGAARGLILWARKSQLH